jgi:hypothetical protein
MFDKPATNKQTHSEQNGDDSQPILPRPPKGQQETDAEHNTRNLARDDVEAAEGE